MHFIYYYSDRDSGYMLEVWIEKMNRVQDSGVKNE